MDAPSRRHLLLGTLMLTGGALAGRGARAAPARIDERAVGDFDAIEWHAVGELVIEQRATERVRVEAEPDVLPRILIEVKQRCLFVTLAPGRLQTQQPIRIHVALRSLRALRTFGAGDVHIGSLRGDTLELDLEASGDVHVAELTVRQFALRMAGSGDVTIARGQADSQRLAIDGSGRYLAPQLASRRATVQIDGSGSAEIAVRDTLDAEIGGSGEIGYRGAPALRQRITGAGRVARLAP
jgi:hypothetical protein